MLTRLDISNYAAYAHQEVDFQPGVIALVGSNGHGKSALLETVPYLLFGSSRPGLTVSDMVREKGDGTMRVEGTFRDIPAAGDELVIERGWKSSGFASIKLNGILEATGKGCAAWIEERLGITESLFLLTRFFGMGAQDKLMDTRSSQRLETLQAIAGVDRFRAAHKEASSRLSLVQDRVMKGQGFLAGLTHQESADWYRKRIVEVTKTIATLSAQQTTIRKQIADASAEEEKQRTILVDLDKSETLLRRAKKQRTPILEATEDVAEELSDSVKLIQNLKGQIETQQAILAKSSQKALEKESSDLGNTIQTLKIQISLRDTAQGVAATDCPLCGHPLAEHTAVRWEEERRELQKQHDAAKSRYDVLRVHLTEHASAVRKIASSESQIVSLREQISRTERQSESLAQELRKVDREIQALETRVDKLRETATAADDRDETGRLTEALSEVHRRLGAAQQELQELRDDAEKAAVQRKKKRAAVARLVRLKNETTALTVVREAFGRYGIPATMLRDLLDMIEVRASEIYCEFESGVIRTQEVTDRGRPGVDFVLEHRTGVRKYSQLSSGQKVMVDLSVRLAVAQILTESRRVGIDFLMLDEVTGPLAEDRRDDLVRFISRALVRRFPQVVVVSHAPLRDVFSETLQVTMHGDVSEISVL